jgi:hypothetical protein
LNGYGEISGYLWKGFVDGKFEWEFYILIRVDPSPEFNIILKTWSELCQSNPCFGRTWPDTQFFSRGTGQLSQYYKPKP